ncbi:MAG TPA: hypothetical protein VF247_01865 [Candidatus Krumholzibacteria bacterium]
MTTRTLSVHLALAAAFALVAAACDSTTFPPEHKSTPTRVATPGDRRVVIFIIDGPRYSELFGDPTHQHVPGMWNTLRPLGTLCSNYRNLGYTITNPGHATLLSGAWQYIDNLGNTRPLQPTLFEYYRKATGAPASDAVLVGGKLKLDAVTYSTGADYGAAYGASSSLDYQDDYGTYDALIQHLNQDSPHLVMASFSHVDQVGHSGVWSDYLRQIEIVDSLAVLTWNHLQADPDYAGKTCMIITADHGRHDDAHGGFSGHGDSCDGCQHIPFLALGPGIRADYEVTSQYTQRDLCRTVGAILGFSTPRSAGLTMQPIFEPSTTGVEN